VKLKVPNKIKLYSIFNSVTVKPLPKKHGEYDYGKKTIFIDTAFADHARTEILFHEVAEAINYTCELRLPHWKINAMGEGFHEFILNNIDRMIDSDKGD